MATTACGVRLPTQRAVFVKAEPLRPRQTHARLLPLLDRGFCRRRRSTVVVASAPSTPPDISEKVSESIKKAEEACEGDAVAGECAAAWDEVEELSAAASHARDKLKADSDPLENYCKDNPETDECRTYDN
ncbi:Calvin cycle protein [Musa troglodytarum]|nr:Calvin cycle protein [Musa troglodytarum]